MVGAVLLAAAITLAPPTESAAVFANRTAFAEECTGTANTLPDRLARQARTAFAALGWEVGGAVGPAFTRRAMAAGAAATAFYVHSHGDLYATVQRLSCSLMPGTSRCSGGMARRNGGT